MRSDRKRKPAVPAGRSGVLRFRIGGRGAALLRFAPPRRELRSLTGAEREVALMASRGFSNREIAAAREVSLRTVEAQLRAVFRKLNISSRTDLASVLAEA